MYHGYRLGMMMLIVVLLSGCLYPQDKRQQIDQLSNHVSQVQSEVNEYYAEEKVLPYLFKNQEKQFTTKYLVDFRELMQIPPTAYERGGSFLYTLIDVEKEPTVRVFDMRVHEKVSQVQAQIKAYIEKNGLQEMQLKDGYKPIAFEQFNLDPVNIPSPYYPEMNLGWLMDEKGEVYLDYRADIMRMIQEKSPTLSPQQDLRLWLAKQSLYVPAYSPPMIFTGQEPQWVPNKE